MHTNLLIITERIKTPMIRYKKGGKLIPVTWDNAIHFIAEKLKEAGDKVGVVASSRLTNESIFTLKRFATEVCRKQIIMLFRMLMILHLYLTI